MHAFAEERWLTAFAKSISCDSTAFSFPPPVIQPSNSRPSVSWGINTRAESNDARALAAVMLVLRKSLSLSGMMVAPDELNLDVRLIRWRICRLDGAEVQREER